MRAAFSKACSKIGEPGHYCLDKQLAAAEGCPITVSISAEASKYLRTIEAIYEAAGRPNLKAWYFDAGKTKRVHTELVSLGLVLKVLGTEKGYAWRLTETGAAGFRSPL